MPDVVALTEAGGTALAKLSHGSMSGCKDLSSDDSKDDLEQYDVGEDLRSVSFVGDDLPSGDSRDDMGLDAMDREGECTTQANSDRNDIECKVVAEEPQFDGETVKFYTCYLSERSLRWSEYVRCQRTYVVRMPVATVAVKQATWADVGSSSGEETMVKESNLGGDGWKYGGWLTDRPGPGPHVSLDDWFYV